MRFAKKVELKRKAEKPIQFIFSSLAILLEKIDDVKRKRAKEKTYSEKKIVKAFSAMLDYYLYESDGQFTDVVEEDGRREESIVLIPDYNYRTFDYDVYNYNNFVHDADHRMIKYKRIMSVARYGQTDTYLKIFNEICSLGKKLTKEELEDICSYYSTFSGKKILDYEMYDKLKGREVYVITRNIYEEKIINYVKQFK